MNIQYLAKEIRPYVVGNQLTYDDFEKIFGFIPLKEQYKICDVLQDELNIEMVGEIDSPPVEEEIPPEIAQLIVRQPREIKASNKTLIRWIQAGDEQARQDLCVKNVGLVGKFAVKYRKKYADKLELEDLMQEGYLGLIKAAERFNFDKGTEFSTYATFWIEQAVQRTIIDTGFVVRIPVHMVEKILRATKLDQNFQMQGVTVRERLDLIAAEMSTTADEVRNFFRLRDVYLNMISLDLPVGEDNDTPLADFIPDKDNPLEDTVEILLLREQLDEVLGTLTPREREILELRYGLADGRERTLEDVGKIFNVTRERIRQIQEKALRKLRHPARSKKLREFLD